MFYRAVEVLAFATHLTFLGYLVVGGFLAWRWPRSIVVHVAVVAWGVGSVLIGFECPLTALENWARLEAGRSGLPPDGFISHYLTGVVYPGDAVNQVRLVVASVVVVSWVGFVRRVRRTSEVDASTKVVSG